MRDISRAGLDKKGETILKVLMENSRVSFMEIGKAVDLSESAVRRRVANLVRKRVIKKFTIEMEFGQGANAITLSSVGPSVPTSEVSRKLKAIKGIDVVYEITGQYDVAAIISAPNIVGINECVDEIRRISGVATTNTVIILKVIR